VSFLAGQRGFPQTLGKVVKLEAPGGVTLVL
jgi:hypothetical protein